MNVYNYIDEYGMYSFTERKINLVDIVIFSFLSYVNFDNIISNHKISLKEVGRMHLGLHSAKEKNIIAVREANKLLGYLCDTTRYKDCLLFNYVYEGNQDLQFGAISIEYLKNQVYVSFEGTDQLFSGWKENLVLSYEFPTLSHKKAIYYLNKYFTFSNKKLIVGGHSKGGNLALVASMYANILVKNKIQKIYNIDGPGLLDKQFYSATYEKIIPKYKHIIPDNSIIGMFLNNSNDFVIKSNIKGPLAHDIVFWEVNRSSFVKAKLSSYSKGLRREIKDWLVKYNIEEKKQFIHNLELILQKANITSILELKEEKKNILKLVYEAKELDEKSRKILIEFITLFISSYNNSKKEELKQIIKKFK